jgi:hypothetical protein
MKEFKQKENEPRKDYLVRIAIWYIEQHTGFVGIDDRVIYDEAECGALAEDLRIEFDIDED